jgi:streptogramin lyase
MIGFAGFNICMLLVLFVAARLRHPKTRLWVRGLSLAASATFLIGLMISPVSAAMITEYWYGPNPARPWEIACDTSANQAFYTAQMSNRIGLVQWGASKFYEWTIPTSDATPWGIALGPEIATDQGTFVWFTETASSKIGRLNPITGEFVEWSTIFASSQPRDIVVDKTRLVVYFTEFVGNRIGKLVYVAGTGWRMTEYPLPAPSSGPLHMALDDDGMVWFTVPGSNQVGRFNPFKGGGAGAEFTMYSVPSYPNGIIVDKDGFVWFTSQGTWSICRLNWWKNETTRWEIPSTGCNPAELIIDQDSSVFFTEFATSKIGKFVPGTGDFYEYPTPSAGSQPYGIGIHSSGVIVFTEAQTNRLGRLFQPANVGGGDTKTTTVNWISHASTITSAAGTVCATTTIASITVSMSTVATTSTESAWSTTQSTISETKSVLYTSSTSTSTQTSTSTTVTSTTTSTTTTKTSTSTETSTTTTTTSSTSTSTTTETSSSTTTVTYPTTTYFPTITSIAVVSWTSTSTSTTIATTSQTTETTRVTVVTTYLTTVTSTPTTRQCIIASAAHGSELAPDVQFLRMFRDLSVQGTFAGTAFMNAFNAFYYSFSPTVARTITQYPVLQETVKVLLYPLITVLRAASAGFNALGFAPELAVITSGLIASALIGVAYLTPLVGLTTLCSKKLRRRR